MTALETLISRVTKEAITLAKFREGFVGRNDIPTGRGPQAGIAFRTTLNF